MKQYNIVMILVSKYFYNTKIVFSVLFNLDNINVNLVVILVSQIKKKISFKLHYSVDKCQ